MNTHRTDLDRFFDLALDIFAIANVDGRWIRASAAVTAVLGYTVEEFLSIRYMDMIHPDDHAKTLQAIERQMQRGEAITQFEARFRHKNGSWRVLSWRSQPEGDLMYAVARDVTDTAAAVEMRASELAAANQRLAEQLQRL